jgi:CBS domain-containing protein
MQSDGSRNSPLRVRVRTRRTLAGNGDIEVARSVSCARNGGDVPLRTCLGRDCCAGFDAVESGSHVHCEADERGAEQLVRLHVREQGHGSTTRQSLARRTPVSEVMTAEILCVRADVSVDALVPLLLEHGISAVTVVDASGAPLGVVSKTDLLRERYENSDLLELRRARLRDEDGPTSRLGDGYRESNVGRTLVKDLMFGMTLALPESATTSQAGALMAYEGIHRLPVVNLEGKVVGVVSALDILRWLARQDGYVVENGQTD